MASMQVEDQVREKLTAGLHNQTRHEVHLERYIKWSKPRPGPLPPTIDAGKEVTFTGFPSKGAVIYAGPVINELGASPAWVLAWDTADKTLVPPSPTKVYVTCGSKYIIEKMTDNEILKKLNESPSPLGTASDRITKSTIYANLTHLNPSDDFLKANFGELIG